MQAIFNQSVDLQRFSISEVTDHFLQNAAYSQFVSELEQKFTKSEVKRVVKCLLRFAFYIEPVNDNVTSTKFAVRWSDRLIGDPRYCSFDTCSIIFLQLTAEVGQALNDPQKIEILRLTDKSMIAYELNIDYLDRTANPIHEPKNIYFFWDDFVRQAYLLRKYLRNLTNQQHKKFFVETYDKIKTKAYLTDRVQTGVHKTNREKRWECHPESVHFALRRECLKIELKLIIQICHFVAFPEDLKKLIRENSHVQITGDFTLCPITLDPIQFAEFEAEILTPTHGKSSVQVGHIHPLKSIAENMYSGHTADNISWISSVGNRIQGELSVDETRQMIYRIIDNYREAGLIK
jgi:hypothetical protein